MKYETLGQLPNGSIFRPVDCTALLLVRVCGQTHCSVVAAADPVSGALTGNGVFMCDKRQVQVVSLGRGGKKAVANSRLIAAQAKGYFFTSDPQLILAATAKANKMRNKKAARGGAAKREAYAQAAKQNQQTPLNASHQVPAILGLAANKQRPNAHVNGPRVKPAKLMFAL